MAAAKQSFVYELVDVQAVSVDNPAKAIRQGTFTGPTYKIDCDLLICGGGIGGTAAALAATEEALPYGREEKGLPTIKVCLTEETDWIGGQMTAQGVSALDENYLVEISGACLRYQELRQAMRKHYKENYRLSDRAFNKEFLNPGSCWVSWLSFEPKVALSLLFELLQPAIDRGDLSVYTRLKPLYVRFANGELNIVGNSGKTTIASLTDRAPDKIAGVGMLNLDTGEIYEFCPKLCLDATELGDLLPLANVEYATGSDARSNTGEPHAPEVGDAENVQDFTYPFVVDLRPEQNNTIPKPREYDALNAHGKFSFQGYRMFTQATRQSASGNTNTLLPFWEYRRLLAKHNFVDDRIPNDVAMINWDSNDVRGCNLIDQTPLTQAQHLAMGKLISLGFLYWLQTEAPRDDGGHGYPELCLRTDILGTADGLSKYPYIRESRRISPHRRVVEQDIVAAHNSGARATLFPDSVGIGLYPVDIHGMQEVPGAGQPTKPFQIPLSALVPKRPINLLPACKNIGVTHITNGAYRLHPVEWAIGEAQGTLCRFLLHDGGHIEPLFHDPRALNRLQSLLVARGIPIFWFDDVPTNSPFFAAIQMLAVTGVMCASSSDLHFRPDEAITYGEASAAIARAKQAYTDAAGALDFCMKHGFFSKEASLQERLSEADMDQLSKKLHARRPAARPLSRAQFADWLFHSNECHKLTGVLSKTSG